MGNASSPSSSSWLLCFHLLWINDLKVHEKGKEVKRIFIWSTCEGVKRSCSWHDVPKRADIPGDAKGQKIHHSHDSKGRLRTIGPQCPFLNFWARAWGSCVALWSSKLWKQTIFFYQNPVTKIILLSCPVWSPVFKVDGQQGSSSRNFTKEDIRDFQSTFILWRLTVFFGFFFCCCKKNPCFFKIMQLCCNYVICFLISEVQPWIKNCALKNVNYHPWLSVNKWKKTSP